MKSNIDNDVVNDFGREWDRFKQGENISGELADAFTEYFGIFSFDQLPKRSVVADVGCGSGRWGRLVSKQVYHLHMIDPSQQALSVAKDNLKNQENVTFHNASVETIPLENESLDFAYSLGVLHHVPDTASAISSIVEKLKHGAPILLYLYYAFDNQPFWYKRIWQLSNIFRLIISKLPYFIKTIVCDFIAMLVYLPLAKSAFILEKKGVNVKSWPLSAYRKKSFYSMRTDALDRFGTKLEKRFTRNDIYKMMHAAGLERIQFSDSVPYWVVLAYKS